MSVAVFLASTYVWFFITGSNSPILNESHTTRILVTNVTCHLEQWATIARGEPWPARGSSISLAADYGNSTGVRRRDKWGGDGQNEGGMGGRIRAGRRLYWHSYPTGILFQASIRLPALFWLVQVWLDLLWPRRLAPRYGNQVPLPGRDFQYSPPGRMPFTLRQCDYIGGGGKG